MKIYTLHKKLKLPITIDEAWTFLSNPENLKIITPDYMSFDIVSTIDRPLYTGQIIQYIVTPLLGIKTKWVSEITHIEEKKYFVDEQMYGPYALWHHKHFL
jgi:ligand-binding SRPBCC domain-containing protein